MGEALNTSVAEVQRKIHNLRNQVSISRTVLHVLCSLCEMDYEFVHCIIYVNVQSVLPKHIWVRRCTFGQFWVFIFL
jgi:hypothetical protein